MGIKDKIYSNAPHFFQNVMVSFFDFLQYSKRHAGVYRHYKTYFKNSELFSKEQLNQKKEKRLTQFINQICQNSPYFNKLLKEFIDNPIKDFKSIPFSTKEELRQYIDEIVPNKKNSFVSNTGGTTGKSLKVYYTWDNAQERFACLDNFKERFGWKFGEKTAWFSGKSLLNNTDIKKNRYWKTDFFYNIRYYSTFHVNERSVKHYVENFNKYQPLFFSGFPSTISEIARIGLNKGLKLNYQVKAIFPTAETLTQEDKKIMETFYGAVVADQYASSEGAPFITQCINGHLHIEELSGIFEVLDENLQPADSGELVVTSFTTEKTPLLRYRIGDYISLDNTTTCSVHTGRIVKRIEGRVNDYIFSKETGKINLGNISNCVKYTPSIVKFQILQNSLDAIEVKIVVDSNFNAKQEKVFHVELIKRFGSKIKINLKEVKDIPREKSGKYRIVINYIKDEIEAYLEIKNTSNLKSKI